MNRVSARVLTIGGYGRHGPITPCLIPHSAKVVEEYLGHAEGTEERTMLERRFGKKNIQRLVAVFLEEQANKEWLKASTMACPGCQVHVEKTLGCNHVGFVGDAIGLVTHMMNLDDVRKVLAALLLPMWATHRRTGPL